MPDSILYRVILELRSVRKERDPGACYTLSKQPISPNYTILKFMYVNHVTIKFNCVMALSGGWEIFARIN